jgi:2-dehydropantoate 2-reductase
MRTLVVGAGATGGYFGGRLLQVGRDVTFLVRKERAARLAETGLVIKSVCGDVHLPSPPTVLAGEIRQPFDVVLLSCKSYDLDDAISALAPAVGPETAVVPLLNGMRHLDVLDERLGRRHVLGGTCIISSRCDESGRILHLNDVHTLTFGERSEDQAPLSRAAAAAFGGAAFEAKASHDIILEMWEKWVVLATLAGITCLMRAAVGDIVTAAGADLSAALLEECLAIAAAAGRPVRPAFLERVRPRLFDARSPLTASMLGDLERGGRTEADHVLGDLLGRRATVPAHDHSLLRIAYTSLKAAEARRAREKAKS